MLVNNSYRTEFMCYAYGIGIFVLLYLGKMRWVFAVSVSMSLLYTLYFCYYLTHTRGAVQEIRYSAHDFSRLVDQFLVEHSLSKPSEEDEDRFGDCVICMEDFSQRGQPHTLHCPCRDNYYHKACIRQWLLKSATCPICRSDLKSKVWVYV